MEDKQTLKFEGYESAAIAHIIFEVAIRQAGCAPPGSTSADLKLTPDIVREAANLTFLALDLIEEWKAR